VVSAAVAGTDYVIPSALSGYLPLSGGTLTGALNGTSAAFSGAGSFLGDVGIGTTSPQRQVTINSSFPVLQFTNPTTGTTSGDGLLIYQSGLNGTISNQEAGALIFETSNTEAGRISSARNWLIKTTTDNGTDALQVAGSALFTGQINANNVASNIRLKGDGGTGNDGLVYMTVGGVLGFTNVNGTRGFTIDASNVLAHTGSITATGLTINNNTGGINLNRTATSNYVGTYLQTAGTSSWFIGLRESPANSHYRIYSEALSTDVLSLNNTTGAATFSSSVTATNASLTASTASSSTTTGALVVTGGVGVGGAIWAGSGFFESDKRWKNIDSRIASNSSIDAIRWTWNDSHKIDNRHHWGYSAQEVLEVLPEAVSKTNEGFYGIEYNSVFTYKIANLEKLVSELEKKIEKLEKKDKKTKKDKK